MNLGGLDLKEILGKFRWFGDLTEEHQRAMREEVLGRFLGETSREQFTEILTRWADVAHTDAKRDRFVQLVESGILSRPPT